jgi:outer membrane lipoprotein-sorting protein
MRSGIKAAAAALFCAIVAPVLAQAPAAVRQWTLPALMDALHRSRESSARFVETKYLHLLNQAQKSSGRLVYAAPDRLWKETIEPKPARLTLIGDRLTIEQQGQKTRTISLADYAGIGALVESVRATLAGDLPSLMRYFALTFDGRADGWLLTLSPKEERLREIVTTIHIRGEGTAIREIETIEPDGDRTDMAIFPDSK